MSGNCPLLKDQSKLDIIWQDSDRGSLLLQRETWERPRRPFSWNRRNPPYTNASTSTSRIELRSTSTLRHWR